MGVLVDKRRNLRRWLELRLDNYIDRGLAGSDLRTTHGMAGIHRIARQHGDVVVLGGIQEDLTGIQGILLGLRSADSVANVASGIDVYTAGRIQDSLAVLARNSPHATLSYNWHVAGVEVGAKHRRCALAGNGRATRG